MYPQEDDAKLAASSANAEPEWSVPCYHPKHERGADAPQPAVALGNPDNRSIRNCADWRCPMPEAAYSSNMTEAVAVFHDVKPSKRPSTNCCWLASTMPTSTCSLKRIQLRRSSGRPTRQPPSSRTILRLRASPISPMNPSAKLRAPSSALASMYPPCSAALQ